MRSHTLFLRYVGARDFQKVAALQHEDLGKGYSVLRYKVVLSTMDLDDEFTAEVQKLRHVQTMGYRPCIIWLPAAKMPGRRISYTGHRLGSPECCAFWVIYIYIYIRHFKPTLSSVPASSQSPIPKIEQAGPSGPSWRQRRSHCLEGFPNGGRNRAANCCKNRILPSSPSSLLCVVKS